jgi:hypothetical protein
MVRRAGNRLAGNRLAGNRLAELVRSQKSEGMIRVLAEAAKNIRNAMGLEYDIIIMFGNRR